MKLNREVAALKKLKDKDNGYVDASPQQRIAMVWELTKEAWYFKDKNNDEQRLQRNVAKLIKKSCEVSCCRCICHGSLRLSQGNG